MKYEQQSTAELIRTELWEFTELCENKKMQSLKLKQQMMKFNYDNIDLLWHNWHKYLHYSWLKQK